MCSVSSLPVASQRRSVVIDTPNTEAASPMLTNLSILESIEFGIQPNCSSP
ncbi:hypothetical protein [Methylacidiphilum caldifontis]|uniref:hypothetical protein n=1 Tax=Methylacidiphilum caldifontis TaxID=2795386 RepID=UPI001F5E0A9D|nr:hypothetical protein [Methylacidiphilum caldifontis]